MVKRVAGEEVRKAAYCLGRWHITGPIMAIEQNELEILAQEGRSIILVRWDLYK